MSNVIHFDPGPRYSRVVTYNGMAFIAGQAGEDSSQDIRGQTRQTLATIDGILADIGSDKSCVLSAQIWLKDIARDFAGMNDIWETWVAPNAAPTRATAQCEMAKPELLIEIIITAAVSS